MKAKLKKISMPINHSFSVVMDRRYHSYNDFHYHSELELLYIAEGSGTVILGDKIEQVDKGDLFLLGENVPHMFRFETHKFNFPLHKQGKIELPLQLITLHFSPYLWGEQFINLPENEFLRKAMKNASHVQGFHGVLKQQLVEMLHQLLDAETHERMLLFMKMLATIANGNEFEYLAPQLGNTAFNPTDETRLTKVYLYTLNNFQRTITLKEVAAIIYMCPNAFCRYFKSRTHKSYFDFLLEVRVNHARKLLKETNYSMVIVSWESGFSNLSNFNRCFKNATGQTPLACRKAYRHFFKAR